MATILKSLSLFVILMLINSVFIETEARPLNIMKYSGNSAASKVIEGFFDGLSLGAIKESGPSPGVGHKFTNSQTLGGIKAGPSPGEGHKQVNGNPR
uniref:Transmembrane protein n=1 Tax=Rhizophora mucronata TaxID=61149 RepID=A0A2P2NI55_RHIMU